MCRERMCWARPAHSSLPVGSCAPAYRRRRAHADSRLPALFSFSSLHGVPGCVPDYAPGAGAYLSFTRVCVRACAFSNLRIAEHSEQRTLWSQCLACAHAAPFFNARLESYHNLPRVHALACQLIRRRQRRLSLTEILARMCGNLSEQIAPMPGTRPASS